MSYTNPDTEDLPGLVFTAADTGGVRITSHLDWEEVQQLVPEFRELAGEGAEIDARLVAWAGPYEVYIAVKDIIEGALLLGAGVKAVPKLLTAWAQKHPDTPLTVVDDDGRHIVLSDKKPLSTEDAEAIAAFFAKHQDPPSDTIGGANMPT
ncbi:hypothetical protein C5E16_10920 [Clavibacter michiganensis]|uniref:Uncharacterized protein n=1 Tax=Clavibacter michiganensis TaxID=28447 RepID=A0A2S5VSB2_9MICO|nr:hypothetical protein [Clavibacter michiganensis]PPF66628.1 hypothetical protein C5E16_10920 [Clavibacter michiganensis]